ncbi:MAG: hypothetical protein M3198_19905 [Actinomycetota bacterium]|nr:hypothetical protein [Actinomycetota bacterium]
MRKDKTRMGSRSCGLLLVVALSAAVLVLGATSATAVIAINDTKLILSSDVVT